MIERKREIDYKVSHTFYINISFIYTEYRKIYIEMIARRTIDNSKWCIHGAWEREIDYKEVYFNGKFAQIYTNNWEINTDKSGRYICAYNYTNCSEINKF